MRLPVILGCGLVLVVAGCGGSDDDEPQRAVTATTTAAPRAADCEMTAQAALRVEALLRAGSRPSTRSFVVLRHEGAESLTRTDESPDPRRHVLVLANEDRRATLAGTLLSGGERVTARAAPGCGAVLTVADGGRPRATFTQGGRDAGSVRPGAR